MPSPFPGMDPFIEMQESSDFHGQFLSDIADDLNERAGPKYVVRYQRRVYVEQEAERPQHWEPDSAVLLAQPREAPFGQATGGGTATLAPVSVVLPIPQERREGYLTIRDTETLEIVTLIELLSPSNKRRRGKGRKIYLRKREEVLQTDVHLVELDLLRGGARMPTLVPLPPHDYSVIVSREELRPRADAYSWTLRDAMQKIPVPLLEGDPDLTLDLQELFARRYARARYEQTLNYSAPLEPPLSAGEAEWVANLLRAAGRI
ncbi:MAG TPA: DUF4058 family protein [Planctomycetaceae bacterium]|nr:DUF4058 family protein [Planctomycetaceae bacterium]